MSATIRQETAPRHQPQGSATSAMRCAESSDTQRPLHVLFSAYACAPNRGSEQGAGWNWPRAIAERGHRVTVLTTPRFRSEIEASIQSLPPQKPTYVFVDEPNIGWPWRGLPGQVLVFLKYLLWQHRLPSVARQINGIDIIHHVSWGSLRGGSRLHVLPAPLVFGPVGGGQKAPDGLVGFLGHHARGERLRSILVGPHIMRWIGNARRVARHASAVLVTNSDTYRQARALGAQRVELMLDSGIAPGFLSTGSHRDWTSPTLELLWLGRLLPIKGLAIALEALARLGPRVSVRLRIVGDGPEMPRMKALASHLELGNRVEWCGQVPWQDVCSYLDSSHLLVFTSVRDSFGSQLLEASARGLPIMTLDHHGARDHLPDSIAIKIPVGSGARTVDALACAILDVAADRSRLPTMSTAAVAWATQHTWEKKAEECERIYRTARE